MLISTASLSKINSFSSNSLVLVHPDWLCWTQLFLNSPRRQSSASKQKQMWRRRRAARWLGSGEFASFSVGSLQNKPRQINSHAGFIISRGTISWAGTRLVWSCLLCVIWSRGWAVVLSLTAFSELCRIRGRLKIPDNKKTTPTTEERLYNTDRLFVDGINAELAHKLPPV